MIGHDSADIHEMSQSGKTGGPQEPKRRGRAGAVGNDALGLADAALRRAGFPDASLITHWADIAGPGVARVAEPVRFTESAGGGVLTLRCEAGAAVFLQHETRPLLSRLNRFLGPGRVARIRLVPGTLQQTPEPPNHPLLGRPPMELPQEPGLSGALTRLSALRRGLKK
jgi:hypothetical protein